MVLDLVVLGILLSILWNALGIGQVKTDHYIAYIGSKPLPEQCVTALENALTQLAPDLTGDGKIKVELRQYITEVGSGTSEDIMYGYAAKVRLLADITDGESYIFLVEDPAQVQLDFQILAEADGSMPEDDDFLTADKVYRWENCPVLAGLTLGDYAEQVLDQTVTGSCQALLTDLYVGRRYYYDESTVSHLSENQVDVSGMVTDSAQHTTLAVVALDKTGERTFSFYRDPSADVNLSVEDISEEQLKNTRFLHFGSVSLTAEPARSATLYTAKTAKVHGATVSYDPNYRPSLWPDEETAVQRMVEPLSMVDVLKVSDEELPLLTGTRDLEAGTEILAKQGIRLVLVTLGPNGAYYRFDGKCGHVPGVKCVVGDTNGAGDTFFGAVLAQLAQSGGLDCLTAERLEQIVAYANKAASITTSRHGAIPAMPSYQEVFE